MATTIKCNHCHQEIEITQAIRQELQEKILQEVEARHHHQLQQIQQQHIAQLEARKQEFDSARIQITKEAREEAIQKVRQEYDAKIESTKDEADTRLKQNQQLQQQIKELLIQLRQSKDAQSQLAIDYEKKLLMEQDAIKQQAKSEAHAEMQFRLLEKDKKISDAEKQILDLQRKLQQGSQQLQGEVQELSLEDKLRSTFIYDEIKEVPKGIRGADIIQIVRTNQGIPCGTIIWESKNTRAWSDGWISKIKADQRVLKAEIAVIVTSVLPPSIQHFGIIQGVWMANFATAINLAQALRQQLLQVHKTHQINQGRASQAEIVYNYLASNDFKQRIEVWVEYFQNKQLELQKERMYFMKKWDKEEKQLFNLLQNTAGIYGDLQGLMGNALPKLPALELIDE